MQGKGPSPFGVQLRRLRTAAGLTQEALAEKARVSVDAISTLENGRRQRPHPQTVALLAAGLGLGDDERERFAGLARPARRPAATETQAPSPKRWAGRPRWSRLDRRIRARLLAAACVFAVAAAASLATVAYRWLCPYPLCSQQPASHDQLLDANLTALQAGSYVLPDSPGSYSLGKLPATQGPAAIAAERIDAGDPYRVAIAVHDLRRGGAGTFIESVRLLLRDVGPAPAPLPVWETGTSLDYTSNPYVARYTGQAPGAALATSYAGKVPGAHVQLQPGESDELTIQVSSSLPVHLRFQVLLSYRVASELQVRSLLLPGSLQVTFTDGLDWQPYRLQAGRLVPAAEA
jgi:transcriptional regulator with XRE-family HTH domain